LTIGRLATEIDTFRNPSCHLNEFTGFESLSDKRAHLFTAFLLLHAVHLYQPVVVFLLLTNQRLYFHVLVFLLEGVNQLTFAFQHVSQLLTPGVNLPFQFSYLMKFSSNVIFLVFTLVDFG